MFPSLAIRLPFLLIGLLLLVVGAFSTWSTRNFIDDSVATEGTVVAFDRYRSDGDTLFRPVVVFMTEDGSSVEFTSSFGSSHQRKREGDTVAVLYRPDDPADAEIREFWTLWFGPIVLFGVGALFSAIGAVVFFVFRPERPPRTPTNTIAPTTTRDPSHLREDGLPIRATVTGVVTSAASASEPWWKLVAESTDPKLGERREFVSHRLSVDPMPLVDGGTVDGSTIDGRVNVFIDPEDDEHYLIDLSFLDSEPTFPDQSIDAD